MSQRGIKFAAGAISDVLVGKENSRTEKFGLSALSTYGIMAGRKRKSVAETINTLVMLGYLSRNDEEYRNISITEKGHNAVKNRDRITVKVPVKRNDVGEYYGGSEIPEASEIYASGYGVLSGHEAEIIRLKSSDYGVIDDGLLQRLKEVRTKEAAKARLPAYMVFSNAALEDMAKKKPLTEEEFLNVSGVGDAKLTRYGEVFLGTIAEYLEKKEKDL